MGITDTEREILVEQLRASAAEFERALAEFGPDDWEWSPGAEQWSAAEIAEHVVLTESAIVRLLRGRLLKSPEVEGAGMPDAFLEARIEDRSRKGAAPSGLRPSSAYRSSGAALEEFRRRREQTLEYAGSTSDPLRRHRMPHPMLGAMDGYQWLLFLAAHVRRHTAQLRELSAITSTRTASDS